MGSPVHARQHERHVLVGKGILAGLSIAQAMRDAGYAHATACNPARNGIIPKQCVALALADDPEAATATARVSAITLLNKALAKADPDEINLLTAAKVAEITSKLDLGAESQANSMNPRDFGERVAWMQAAMAAYQGAKAKQDEAKSVLSLEAETLQATEDAGDTCTKVT